MNSAVHEMDWRVGLRFLMILSMLASLAALIGGVAVVEAENSILAASGIVDITPTRPAYIAGYGSNRKSIDAHDPLSARCLILESAGTRIAFVSCDLIGIPRYDSLKIRTLVKSVTAANLYISATHTHSGPDTLGQWGPDIQTSGVDKLWLNDTLTKIAQLVDATSAKIQPVILKFANTADVPHVSKNIRIKQVLDTEMGVMQAVSTATGKPVATLVNFACHPEILNNHHMSSDFPNWLYKTVEMKTGAPCLYLNGAQGGMITADFDESVPPKGENWKAAEKIGTKLGNRALEMLVDAQEIKAAPIQTKQLIFQVPMENPQFKMLIKLKVFSGDIQQGDVITTEVNRITIGPAEIITLPGEVLPNIGFYIKRHMPGNHKFLFGLTCDELGYILSKEDYGLDLYEYETSVSIGSKMGSLMEDSIMQLLEVH